MPHSHLPEPIDPSRLPVRRDGRCLPDHARGNASPNYVARKLGFVEVQGRDHWRNRLDDAAWATACERAGEIIDWWAYVKSDRPYAVVLGRQGLVVTKPWLNDHGAPTSNLIQRWPLAPQSHSEETVTERSGAVVSNYPSTSSPNPIATSRATVNLNDDLRGVLGNLPIAAQEILQKPFVSGDLVRESDYFYYGGEESFDLWCFLAGNRSITFASGRGLRVPGSQPASYSWRGLICRQADVVGSPRLPGDVVVERLDRQPGRLSRQLGRLIRWPSRR